MRAYFAVAKIMTLALVLGAALLLRAQAQSPAPKSALPENVQHGKVLYVNYGCYACHGRAAQGAASTGPRLAPRPIELARFISYCRQPTGQMPPYTSKIVSNAELADIHAFLRSLPEAPKRANIPELK